MNVRLEGPRLEWINYAESLVVAENAKLGEVYFSISFDVHVRPQLLGVLLTKVDFQFLKALEEVGASYLSLLAHVEVPKRQIGILKLIFKTIPYEFCQFLRVDVLVRDLSIG